jgi:hypothetical protein
MAARHVLDDFRPIVRRTIINDDDLIGGFCLSKNAFQRFSNKSCAVIKRDDGCNRNLRRRLSISFWALKN